MAALRCFDGLGNKAVPAGYSGFLEGPYLEILKYPLAVESIR